jgi:hypothetical protein
MLTINEILKDHVTLDIECIDRMYLNGYIPNLQTSGQLVYFLRQRGFKIPSPTLLGEATKKYNATVKAFATENRIPMIQFQSGESKDDIAQAYRTKYQQSEGVVFIGTAQEKSNSFKATTRKGPGSKVGFDYSRQSVYVKHYYFYLQDENFGPGFIKVCTYAPYAVKVYLNGHEWAKQQLTKQGIGFEALDNGFCACDDPARLQTICDELGPSQIQVFFEKWQQRLPWLLTKTDQQAGYKHRLSIWQVEFSRTQIFDDPVRGRQFFEEVIRENPDLGRPDRVQLLFERRVTKATPGYFRTRIIQDGVHPSLHIDYKRCHLKQYFKEGRGLRTEMTVNNSKDFYINKDLSNLPFLQKIGRQVNHRLLEVEHLSQNCTFSGESIERIVQPSVTSDGKRASGLSLGQPRVRALFAALVLFLHIPNGFTNSSLRLHVADLMAVSDETYAASQMSYDLRRLRLKGLIYRYPNSYRYQLTTYGWKVALLLTKFNRRIFQPAFAALDLTNPVPQPLAKALEQVDLNLDDLFTQARLAPSG